MRAIEATGLRFRYGNAKAPALVDVSFSVERGEVFGVLGPNGAGKTTMMKLLSTVLVPESGRLVVLGHELPGGEEAVRAQLGVAFAEYERAFNFRLTARQNLEYFAAFYGIPRREAPARVETALAKVGLTQRADTPFMAFSTGMKHRLALARALLPDPKLLVLDEPTAGLDAQTSRELGLTVRALAQGGVTVVYTTHRLEEAGALCDRVLVLREGRVAALAAPAQLAKLASEVKAIELEIEGILPPLDDVRALPGMLSVDAMGRSRLRAQVTDLDAATEALVAWARKHGHRIAALSTSSASLADAFVAITEGRIQGGVA